LVLDEEAWADPTSIMSSKTWELARARLHERKRKRELPRNELKLRGVQAFLTLEMNLSYSKLPLIRALEDDIVLGVVEGLGDATVRGHDDGDEQCVKMVVRMGSHWI
jgi:hypothetical protein